jgi:hypothetical protein
MLTSYQKRETIYQILFFVFFYFIFLLQTSTNGLFYTTHLVDVILIILFLYFQKLFINFFQTSEEKIIYLNSNTNILPLSVD